MLTEDEIGRLTVIEQELDGLQKNRRQYNAWRDVLHLYEDVARRTTGSDTASQDFIALSKRAADAFRALGGAAEPVASSLASYDAERYGPFLGVSDEGSAAGRIRDAFLKSPKVLASGRIEPLVVGGSVDAERLAGVGETPVGPDEYREIQLACLGRVLTTTNVGTRVNARYYNDPPMLEVENPDKTNAFNAVLPKVKESLERYYRTPDGKPVETTLFLCFDRSVSKEAQLHVLKSVREEMQSGKFSDPTKHHLGLLARVPGAASGVTATLEAIALAAAGGITRLAVEGEIRSEAEERLLMPGLLNFFNKSDVNKLLAAGQEKNISVRRWKQIDTDSVARNTWTSLQTARNMGIYLGKYGLVPLTIEEGDYVIAKIQSWFSDWAAAPAIYIDCPTVTEDRVFDVDDAYEGVKHWLDVLNKHDVRVTLIDTADKSLGRTLLKEKEGDAGILSLKQIQEVDAYARALGIRALWAGGISVPQSYELGKLCLFGIYTTTSTARKIAVSGDYRHDPAMPNQKEPTYSGVYRVKLLVEAGFLHSQLKKKKKSGLAEQIAANANALIEHLQKRPQKVESAQEENLAHSLTEAWRWLLEPDNNHPSTIGA
jgi:hypothetical protein